MIPITKQDFSATGQHPGRHWHQHTVAELYAALGAGRGGPCLQLAVVYLPVLNGLFETVPLRPQELARA